MPYSHPVLIAEDDDDTVFFLERSLQKLGIKNPVNIVRDGAEALQYLEDEKSHKTPQLAILDLKMPLKSGLEVLDQIRQTPGLKRMPVVIFSSSNRAQDVQRAYDLGANSYVVKPTESARMDQFVAKIHDYWLNINERPLLD